MLSAARTLATGLGLIVLGQIPANGMAPPMIFEHVTVEDGLSQGTVLDVLQDSQGFIWIATEAGLNRYDGYEMRRYTHDRGDPGA